MTESDKHAAAKPGGKTGQDRLTPDKRIRQTGEWNNEGWQTMPFPFHQDHFLDISPAVVLVIL